VLLDELEQARVDRRPDRAAHGSGGRRAGHRLVDELTEGAHVLDGDHHLDLGRLAHPGVHDRHRPGSAVLVATEEAGDLIEGPLGGRQADPLERSPGQRDEALQ